MNELINNIKTLIAKTKETYNILVIESIKNPKIKPCLRNIKQMEDAVQGILTNLQHIEETNPNIFVCYENNIYLSVIEKKYVVSRKNQEEVEIIHTTDKLQTALEQFYINAYDVKPKKLKNLFGIIKNIDKL